MVSENEYEQDRLKFHLKQQGSAQAIDYQVG